MATFVLIHGAWEGGWVWKDVARLLRDGGHEAYPVTLTGLGDRAHLARPEIDLELHIRDVTAVMHYEDLDGIVLVGHSYGGIVASGAASKVRERIKHLVYVDAMVLDDGESLLSRMGQEVAELARRAAVDGLVAAPALSGEYAAWKSKVAPHPLRTWEQPLSLGGVDITSIPRTFVACTKSDMKFADQIRGDRSWTLVTIDSDHFPMFQTPDELTRILIEAAGSSR